jgi:hypothetical protein
MQVVALTISATAAAWIINAGNILCTEKTLTAFLDAIRVHVKDVEELLGQSGRRRQTNLRSGLRIGLLALPPDIAAIAILFA